MNEEERKNALENSNVVSEEQVSEAHRKIKLYLTEFEKWEIEQKGGKIGEMVIEPFYKTALITEKAINHFKELEIKENEDVIFDMKEINSVIKLIKKVYKSKELNRVYLKFINKKFVLIVAETKTDGKAYFISVGDLE